MARTIICPESGEEKPHYSRGLCQTCYQRLWRHENPRSHLVSQIKYRHAHQEEEAAYKRQYRPAHREERNAYNHRWRQANLGKARERDRRYRARKAQATIEPVDEAAIYELYNYACIYCGAREGLTLDHVIALNAGGAHCEDNLVVACGFCNSGKRDRPLEEWLQTQPRALAWVA